MSDAARPRGVAHRYRPGHVRRVVPLDEEGHAWVGTGLGHPRHAPGDHRSIRVVALAGYHVQAVGCGIRLDVTRLQTPHAGPAALLRRRGDDASETDAGRIRVGDLHQFQICPGQRDDGVTGAPGRVRSARNGYQSVLLQNARGDTGDGRNRPHDVVERWHDTHRTGWRIGAHDVWGPTSVGIRGHRTSSLTRVSGRLPCRSGTRGAHQRRRQTTRGRS